MPQLDALRGVAILAVFVQHLGDRFMPFVDAELTRALPRALGPWALTVLHHAHWGVDLFFVLSGFSLAQGYLRAFDRGGPAPSARTFLARRAARVLPGFYVALLVTLAFHRSTPALPGFASSLIAHALVLQGYLQPGGIVIIGAAWSLTTEAHFYLLLPLIARPLLDRARGLGRPLLFGGALVLGAWASRAWLHDHGLDPGVRTAWIEDTQRRWITSRLDQFVLGALAAAAHLEITRRASSLAARYAPVGIALSLVALVLGFRLEGELFLEPRGSWPYAIISLATALLVLSATLLHERAHPFLAPRALTALGVWSYGFFLYHQLALGLVGSVLRAPGWWSLAANATGALALSALFGAASWTLIERPAMRWAASGARVQSPPG